MYRFYESFDECGEQRLPYSLNEENLHTYHEPSGYAENGRFCLFRRGARILLNTPALKDFTLSANVGFLPPAVAYFANEEWAFDFGYLPKKRTAQRIAIGYDAKKNSVSATLLKVNGKSSDPICSSIYENVTLDPDASYPFTFKIENGKCKGSFAGLDFSFDIDANLGKIAIASSHTGNGVFFSSLSVESDECVAEVISENEYLIPFYDGGCVPYKINLAVKKFDDVYELSYELSGGSYSKNTPNYKMEVWSVEYDIFTNPYIRFYKGGKAKTLYIKNGTLTFVEQNETIKATELMMGGEKIPYKGSFYLDEFDPDADFAFGYDMFRSLGNELQEGKREFIFRGGELIYSGDSLVDDYVITVKSSENKAITERIPKDIDMYESALSHARENHYFLSDECVRFKVTTYARKNADLVDVRFYLLDAFFEKVQDINYVNVEPKGVDLYKHQINEYSVVLEKMEQGVYHLKVALLLGDEVLSEHTSAFEVLDDSDVSPRESSKIPFMYSGEATPPNIEFNCPDPWIIKPDHNETHYVECMLGVPEIIEKRRGWEILKLYKLKTFMWIDHRTTPKGKSYKEYMKTIKLANYLKLAGPPCYALLPSIFKRDGVLDIYREFEKEHPDYNLPTVTENGEISRHDFDKFYRSYGTEWLTYLSEKNSLNVISMHEDIKKINPNVKFVQYGPYTPYSGRFPGPLGPQGTMSRMILPSLAGKIMDGYWVFEDYPFITDQKSYCSSWGAINNLLHFADVNFAIEIFSNFDPVCPDGAVCFAYPPMGGIYVESYRTVTQVYEHLYATAYREGAFRYYENPAFQFMQVYSTEAPKRMEEFLKGYGVYLKNKPKSPERSIVFVSEYEPSDNRFDMEYSFRGPNNVSQAAEAYLYGLSAMAGLPKGYSTDFKGLCELDRNKIDVCVLPSVKSASESLLNTVRKLSEDGVPLFAVSDVSGLEDLFGVEKDGCARTVSLLENETESEIITKRKTEFFYRPTTAKVLLYAISEDGERVPFILKNGKNVLINAYVVAVGADDFVEHPFGGANVSVLLKDTLMELLRELSTPVATVDGECGISVFSGEDGEKRIVLTDYTKCRSTENKNVTVRLNFEASDVWCVMHEDMQITPSKIKNDGRLLGFGVTLRPGESAMFKLK